MSTAMNRIICGKRTKGGFTLLELVVVLAVLAMLAVMILPSWNMAREKSQSRQCMNNFGQLLAAWRMYGADNNDILAPNDYPFTTAFYGNYNSNQMKNWVVGTMEQPLDAKTTLNNGAFGPGMLELMYSQTLLSHYISDPYVYHCPADYYVDTKSHQVHPRSVSMNSAVGTIYWSSFPVGGSQGAIGMAVQGGWLSGADYIASQNPNWLTYGKMSSFIRPGPANTFVLIDENPNSINDGSFAAAAATTSAGGYIIDYPAINHNHGATIAFADGHAIVHTWLDSATYTPSGIVAPGMGSTSSTTSTPNPDCLYLASITSAPQ
jgi:prepilin-type N-terminal cleavage/methylation domain-containing protein/prepilin-type processing-associated H-X9-DG protein